MPQNKTLDRARQDKRQGKSTSTQAGEFVREEIGNIRAGKHGARSSKQAIAIGLSKARRAGVKLAPPKNASAATKRKARQDIANAGRKPSRKRSAATIKALKREGKASVSKASLSRHAKAAASGRTGAQRSTAAKRAARTRKSRG